MKKPKSLKGILYISMLSAGIFLMPLSIAKESNTINTVDEARSVKACEILADVHAALTVLRVNSDEALYRVDSALASIEKLDNKFSDYSSVNMINNQDDTVEYVYEHYYPELTGPNNYCSNYVFLTINKHNSLNDDEYRIYFDYPLAKAELMTAKFAIVNGDALEARSSLKRGMQAIYINPSFNVSN